MMRMMKCDVAFVYRIFNRAGTLLYVGVTIQPAKRMSMHRSHSPWFHDKLSVVIDGPHERKLADFIEGMAIRFEKPLHNRNGRRCAELPSLDLGRHNDDLHKNAMDRAADVERMRNRGATWAEIGAALNISRQRAQQIASRLPE